MSGWRLRLSVPAAAADAVATALEQGFGEDESPPALVMVETVRPERWDILLYFAEEPEQGRIDTIVSEAQRVAGETLEAVHPEPLPERDWVGESQTLRTPVLAGRIFVHGAHDRHRRRCFGLSLEVEAGQAFGSGQHATTRGCLCMIDTLAKAARPRRMLDLGCGSGVLALAMARLWGRTVLASDIDPVAVRVAGETTRRNRIVLGHAGRPLPVGPRVVLRTANGMADPVIRRGAPYDLIVANILAGPLVAMAPDMAGALAPGGRLILAGMREEQVQRVFAACRAHSLLAVDRLVEDGWATLLLRKGRGDFTRSYAGDGDRIG